MSYSPNFRGSQAKASSRQVETNYVNGSGTFLPKATVVTTNLSGQILPMDVSDESQVDRFVGVTATALFSAATGGVVNNGRIENITTVFAIGDAVYAGQDGVLINVKPAVGVEGFAVGDFVIFLGVIVKNEFNGAQKDLLLMPNVVGQL